MSDAVSALCFIQQVKIVGCARYCYSRDTR